MGEAILVKAGGAGSWNNGGGSTGGQYVPMTEIIQENTTFTMPKTQGQQISVRIFGGGGGAYGSSYGGGGGGGGNMNNAILNIPEGTRISIIIGDAGNMGNSRVICSNGGTTSFGTYLSATGGESSDYSSGGINGGNGGTGGGCSGSGGCNGGSGTYGGGGGGGTSGGYAGNGGIYGGGGGSNGGTRNKWYAISIGGWGGSGQHGFNTIGMSNVEFEGAGICFNSGNALYGGGGSGGNGGNGSSIYTNGQWYNATGGGGGYGGNGGNGYCGTKNAGFSSAGGGGGYGNDGGDSKYNQGGGGGGYGLQGFGHGGGGSYRTAMKGVCILSYSKLVES